MLHYKKVGTGYPLILIHGFPNNSSAWDYLIPFLTKQFTLIIPDLPGSGKSQGFSSEPTIEYMAKKVIEILDYEKIVKCIVAGHSMGGYTALEIASIVPERMQALCLINSSAALDSEEKTINRQKAISLISKSAEGKEAFLKAMIPNLYASSFVANRKEIIEKTFATGMSISAANLSAFYTAIMNRKEHLTTLKNAKYPILWIFGEEDKITPVKEIIHQTILSDKSFVKIYENCGHSSMEEMEERLANDVLHFFSNTSIYTTTN